jgi:YbbR domain-containing protein
LLQKVGWSDKDEARSAKSGLTQTMVTKSALFENLRVKLVVAILATLFWFAVVTENEYEYDVNLPIVAVNVPEGKILATDLPAHARVRFEGKGRALLALMFSREARVILNLTNVRRRHAFELQREMVYTPRSGTGLIPLQILYPDTVRVQLANLAARPIPVIADVKITPVPGYTVMLPWQLRPDSVIVSGPEEAVRHVDSVVTEHQEFANVQDSVSTTLRLQPAAAPARIQFSAQTVKFFADVQKLIEVTLHEIPVRVQNAPTHVKITPVPSTLSLTVEGGEKLLLNLKREDIVAYIDYARIRETATAGHPAYIRTPDGVRYRDVKPTLFKLIMEAKNHAPARH